MSSYHIHIEGQVQGVGFRPRVYRLAQSRGIAGKVTNGTRGLDIVFTAPKEKAEDFYHTVIENKPPRAVILRHYMEPTEPVFYSAFSIAESERENNPVLLHITPDLGLCDDCRKEILHAKDRRFGYPFTTCTQCGPRYSIIKRLPYDREFTAMDAFSMCHSCEEEYHSPLNRRHFSQTNSCPDCAVKLFAFPGNTQESKQLNIPANTSSEDIISLAIDALASGFILAIKESAVTSSSVTLPIGKP
ncbi:MAG: acylphosphatase [Bacteroidia bacterium]